MNYELGKKIISLSIFFVFFPVFTFAASTATVTLGGGNATLALSPASGSYNISDIFSVNILLNTGGYSIQGADVYIIYNPSLLEVQDKDSVAQGTQIQAGSLMTDTLTNSVDSSTGKITFSQVTSGNTGYNGSGTLATVHFKALSQGTASVSFDFTSGKTTDTNIASSGNDILSSVSGASFSVASGGNLLLNPSFEGGFTGNLANNWNITTDGSVGYSIAQDTGYQGSAQKINISSPGSWGLFYYQTPSFQLNQSYNWSFWYKTQGTGSLWAEITNAQHTQVVHSESLPSTNGQWIYKTIPFQYTNSLANQLRFSSNATGSYWIDNVQLAVAPPSQDTIPPSAPSGLVVQ